MQTGLFGNQLAGCNPSTLLLVQKLTWEETKLQTIKKPARAGFFEDRSELLVAQLKLYQFPDIRLGNLG
jgi:hypothetical protein